MNFKNIINQIFKEGKCCGNCKHFKFIKTIPSMSIDFDHCELTIVKRKRDYFCKYWRKND